MAGVPMQRLGKIRTEGAARLLERHQVRRVQAQSISARHIGTPALHPPVLLHRPLQLSLEVDGLEASLEQAGSRPFEESFEEPLHRGQGTSHPVGESSRAPPPARLDGLAGDRTRW